jgi:hypothetical protein
MRRTGHPLCPFNSAKNPLDFIINTTTGLSKRFGTIKNSCIRHDEIGAIPLRLKHVPSILNDAFDFAISG